MLRPAPVKKLMTHSMFPEPPVDVTSYTAPVEKLMTHSMFPGAAGRCSQHQWRSS